MSTGITPTTANPERESPPSILRLLAMPRFGSIRSRILAFAIMATLVPASVTLAISYLQTRRSLEAQITQDLRSASSQTARAMGVWLKERLYDLRVFASSEEVANNLEGRDGVNRGRLSNYLKSLGERFPDFDQLAVLDLNGRAIGGSNHNMSAVRLPKGWLESLRREGQVVGDAFWDERTKKAKLVVAVPVQRADGHPIGVFAADVNMDAMPRLLREFAHDSSSAIHLVTNSGNFIASTSGVTARIMKAKLPTETIAWLSSRETANFKGLGGRQVVGALERVPQTNWSVIAATSTATAFAQLQRSRNMALLVVVALLVAVGASGYRFALLIARPLDRLTFAAAEVASGDLAVDLPDGGSGEVGSLTAVFNHMVSRLREGRRALDDANETLRRKNEELERLSTTDGLTGLANHRLLMQRLSEEVSRCNRHNHEFSVLMADVDHFKAYNDSFGHPAGDEVLKRVAAILRDSTRTVDCAARYGGEEFAVIMPETNAEGAIQLAERIRARIAAERFSGKQITLSIGVASFPRDASTPQSVIGVADAALYQAKRDGRDRVVHAKKAKVAG